MKKREKKRVTNAAWAGALSICAWTLAIAPASAGTVWTDWSGATAGAPGSAAGILDGVSVSFSGQVLASTIFTNTFKGWAPDSSFIGGTVTTSPGGLNDEHGDIIRQDGSFTGVNTLTFGSAVVNPVLAIWSLGTADHAASDTFLNLNLTLTPIVVEAGGPNSTLGGAAVTLVDNIVSGEEGNGVVQFTGTFNTLSWTSALGADDAYGFTVGIAGTSAPSVPEPASLTLLLAAFAGLGLARRRKLT